MVSKGNHPQMALIQVSEMVPGLIYIYRLIQGMFMYNIYNYIYIYTYAIIYLMHDSGVSG